MRMERGREEEEVMMRRGVVVLVGMMLGGVGVEGLVVVVGERVGELYRVLKWAQGREEEDEVVRFHASQALEVLDWLVVGSASGGGSSSIDPRSYTLPIANMARDLGWE